ncbi:tRNA adenosine(34) deaminase TadA [Moraxella nasibovis]|nr:tRNA adenosine(34) deaminase TadA [Moraxella nasibovis]WFF39682.1 tRNA adenosine(34) deaminase TadA [Moraxella nasibovis]
MTIKADDGFDEQDRRFMAIALDLARQAGELGEVPVGAVIVLDGQIIGQGLNCPISQKDSTAHAEMVAIRQACENLDNYRLMGATLYVTLEPCTMCLGAIVHSRISRVIFGASEPKSGVVISQENFAEKRYFNHYLTIEGGLFAEQSKAILQGFFKSRRLAKKDKNLS